jgi:opacity protein-like surface antigen
MKRIFGLLVVLSLMSVVSLSQGLGFKGVGGAIGFASISYSGTTSSESMSGFLIAAHADLGEFTKDFSLVPDIQYFSTSKDLGSGYTLKVSNFAINANAHYNLQMEGMLKPYVGAGLGYNSFSTTVPGVAVPGYGTVGGGTATDSRFGINLLAGVNYKLNDMLTLVVEPRYVLVSDYNYFLIKAGITYAMK